MVERLKAEGLVVRIPGRGTYTPFAPDDGTLPRSTTDPVESLVHALREQIASGALKLGESLPQLKFLRLQFGVASETITRAYRRLVAQGLATRMGKHYVVGSPREVLSREQSRRAVLYDVADEGFATMFERSELKTPAFLAMERELIHQGFRVEYGEAADFRRDVAGTSLPDAVICSWVDRPRYDRVMEALQKPMATSRGPHRPLVVTGSSRRPPSGVQQLCTGHVSTMVARRCAEFIHRKRYRQPAFFCRIDGWSMWPLLAHLKIFRELDTLGAEATMRFAVELNRYFRDGPDFVNRFWTKYRAEGDHLVRVLGEKRAATFCDEALGSSFAYSLQESLDQNQEADLWLFERDCDASVALHWLAEKGRRVPDHISVMSLENREDHFHLGLTSCTPDWQTIGYLMAHAVIGDIPVTRTSGGFLRTEALMLPRQTTR